MPRLIHIDACLLGTEHPTTFKVLRPLGTDFSASNLRCTIPILFSPMSESIYSSVGPFQGG